MIGIVEYGAGNLRSVEFALEELNVPHRRVARPADLGEADRILLPGVGAAGSAMRELRHRGLADALRETERPLLGVCLGMQLLVESSDEGGGEVRTLGLIPGRTRRIRTDAPLPHIGWNRVEPVAGAEDAAPDAEGDRRAADATPRADPLFAGIPDEGGRGFHGYFLHGHRVRCGAEHVRGWTEYGERLPAAIRDGRVAGLQFHPEKSGPAGLRILENFCRSGEAS